MDVVYVTRNGENPELRYSLRSLSNIDHNQVWVFGGLPAWLDTHVVNVRIRRQSPADPYGSVRGHIAAACNTPDVSDPFMLWNDDFYAMRYVGEIPPMHRGPLSKLVAEMEHLNTPWVRGLREVAEALSEWTNPVSYDVHAPLIVHKNDMREALRWASSAKNSAAHVRTFYGNLADLGGFEIEDPKLLRRNDPFPQGPWWSSSDYTFRTPMEPVLRYLFPNPSIYEKV